MAGGRNNSRGRAHFEITKKIEMGFPKGIPQRPSAGQQMSRRFEAAPGLLLLLVTKGVDLVLWQVKEQGWFLEPQEQSV